jgi:hypothetical protein
MAVEIKNILLTAALTESSGRLSNTWIVIKSDASAIISVATKFLRTTSLTASRCEGLILPVFYFKCMILYPAKYIDTTLRFKELPLSLCNTIAVTSLAESGLLSALGIMDKELLDSRVIVTGSPALRFISIIHLLGNDRMYVDLPVNCILRTSLLSDIEVNYDIVEKLLG